VTPLLLLDKPFDDAMMRQGSVIKLGSWLDASLYSPPQLPQPDLQPYPNFEAINDSCQRVMSMTDSLLEHLSHSIPKELKISEALPFRFWQIFLSIYLSHVTMRIEDLRLRCACLAGKDFIYGAPASSEPTEPPQDLRDVLMELRQSTRFHHHFMDICMRHLIPIKEERPVQYRLDATALSSRTPFWWTFLRQGLYWLLSFWPSNTKAFLSEKHHQTWGTLFRLATKGLPPFRIPPWQKTGVKVRADSALREKVFKGLPPLYAEVLSATFPTSALEGLTQTLQEAHQLIKATSKTTGMQLYTHGQLWIQSAPLRAASGLLASQGAKIIDMQHGGGYGISISTYIQTEYKLPDQFISWGWKDEVLPKKTTVIPMPSIYLSTLANQPSKPPKWKVLLLVHSDPRFPIYISSFMFTEMASDYFRRQEQLLNGFRKVTPSAIKLYPGEFGWKHNPWIKSSYAEFDILEKEKFSSLIPLASLCVADYNASGFLELLAMGKPFLIIWDRKWSRGFPKFEGYMDRLETAGIFHRTPESLLHTYDTIQSDITSWWKDPTRQALLAEMSRSYAWHSTSSVETLTAFMAQNN